jgi:hypothetical protein
MRAKTAYLVAQAILVAVWWLSLALQPDVRHWFRPANAPDSMLLAFWLADLVCVIFGSGLAAWLMHNRDPRRAFVLSFTSGALVYGLLYGVALSLMTGEAWLGVLLMAPATALTLLITRDESK